MIFSLTYVTKNIVQMTIAQNLLFQNVNWFAFLLSGGKNVGIKYRAMVTGEMFVSFLLLYNKVEGGQGGYSQSFSRGYSEC